jgi:hypothetical protein
MGADGAEAGVQSQANQKLLRDESEQGVSW